MKTLLYIATILLLLTSYTSGGQYIYRTTDDGKVIFNKAAPYASTCEQEAVLFDTLDKLAYFKKDLAQYFGKQLNWQKMDAISGAIFIQLNIDTNGKACLKCVSHMSFHSGKQIGELGLDKAIEAMPLWRPASHKGKPVNASTIVVLYCRVADRHKEFDVDYFRIKKPQEVKQYNYKE